jgi:hypothetical protein
MGRWMVFPYPTIGVLVTSAKRTTMIVVREVTLLIIFYPSSLWSLCTAPVTVRAA